MKKGSQARRKLLPQVCIRKKKSAERGVSPLARGEEGYAPSTAPPFEKGGRKLSLIMKGAKFFDICLYY